MTENPELRERYAKAIYEHANPGCRWEDAHPDDVHCYGSDAYAVLSARDDELTAVEARAEQAVAGLESSRRRAVLFVERIDAGRAWARKHLTAEQQAGLFGALRGDAEPQSILGGDRISLRKADVDLATAERSRDGWRRDYAELAETYKRVYARADRAETAVGRVRAELDAIDRDAARLDASEPSFRDAYADVATRIRTVLETPKGQPR